MVALPTLIPLSEAARKYGLDEERLRELVEKGKIRAGRLPGSDEVLVSEDEVQKRAEKEQDSGVRKEDLPEYQQFSYLSNSYLGINEASKKYRIPYTTLYRWIRRGFISVKGQAGQKVLISEQDVAFCELIYRPQKRQGKKIFTANGIPVQRGAL